MKNYDEENPHENLFSPLGSGKIMPHKQ